MSPLTSAGFCQGTLKSTADGSEVQRWGLRGRKASRLPHQGFKPVDTQLLPTALCWGRLWTQPVPGPSSRLTWWVQSFCGQSSPKKTSHTAHLPGSGSLNLSPEGCAHSLFPTTLSYLLSSPVLPLQRAFKQVEVRSLTCLHSRNGAGTPVLALPAQGSALTLTSLCSQRREEHGRAVGDGRSRRRS